MRDQLWIRWAAVLGFALGGFFDGILLHQILQWHHLLSLVPAVDSIRLQVLWDGYFHGLMYIVAAVGLWGLWRGRADHPDGSGRHAVGGILIGFGLWHLVDTVLSHWVLGIHRVKLDSPNPLVWDLGWFAAFGVVPLLIGWLLLRRSAARARINSSGLPLIIVGLLTVGAAGWSAQPAPDQRFTTVVFSPSISPQEAMAAVAAEGAALVWGDETMGVLVVDVPEERRTNFYRRGALLVGGAGSVAGCFNWSRV